MSDLCPVLWCFLFRAPLDLVLPCVCPYLITFLFLAQFVSSCVIILFTFSILKPCVFLSLTSGIKVDVVFLCVSALPCVPRFGYWIKDCYFVFTPHLLASLVLFRDSMQMSKIKKNYLCPIQILQGMPWYSVLFSHYLVFLHCKHALIYNGLLTSEKWREEETYNCDIPTNFV